MTRFFGKVGFITESVETRPGIYENVVGERSYYGQVLDNTRYFVKSDSVLGEISFQTRISIVADAYLQKSYRDIRYVEWAGSTFIVDSVQYERPRLILLLGEEYHGPKPT